MLEIVHGLSSIQQIPYRHRLPLSLSGFGGGSHGIQEVRNRLISHPLRPQFSDHFNDLLLFLAGNDLPVLESFAIGQVRLPQLLSLIPAAKRDLKLPEMPHNRRSGGTDKIGDLLCREPFYEVFCSEELDVSMPRIYLELYEI
jgi:hypothetical protein